MTVTVNRDAQQSTGCTIRQRNQTGAHVNQRLTTQQVGVKLVGMAWMDPGFGWGPQMLIKVQDVFSNDFCPIFIGNPIF